jgi:hypothetical protein
MHPLEIARRQAGVPMKCAPARSRRKRRQREPDGESAVYDGARLLGVIRWRRRVCRATTADGKAHGAFPTSVLAMRSITAASKRRAIGEPDGDPKP